MKHPTPEDLIALLYGETVPEQHEELTRHLDGCSQCRRRLDSWQANRARLQAWKLLPAASPTAGLTRIPAPAVAAWKWAAAALVMIGLGYGLARITTPATDPERLRAELTGELKAELAQFTSDQTARQQQYQQAITKAIGRIEAQRSLELASLRQDVETVAVNAQDQLDSTRKGLIALAVSTESGQPKVPKH